MGPGPFGAGDLFGGGCKTACKIIECGEKMVFSTFTQSEIGRYEDLDRVYRCSSFTQITLMKNYNVRTREIKKSTLN